MDVRYPMKCSTKYFIGKIPLGSNPMNQRTNIEKILRVSILRKSYKIPSNQGSPYVFSVHNQTNSNPTGI